ncbi:MAG: sulfurtransferase TusA family protein [Pseudomonadales bacterium]|nr:sulfurtransferase TusA family protein [Pseudomonadales bacterium]
MVEITKQLDATDLRCPLPLLKAKKALNDMAEGEVLEVRATDPGSERDFKVFAQQSSHEMISFKKEADVFVYQLRKGA